MAKLAMWVSIKLQTSGDILVNERRLWSFSGVEKRVREHGLVWGGRQGRGAVLVLIVSKCPLFPSY
jgi:hypothetical protein